MLLPCASVMLYIIRALAGYCFLLLHFFAPRESWCIVMQVFSDVGHSSIVSIACMCECVCVCVCVCLHASCVGACIRACVHACVRVCQCLCAKNLVLHGASWTHLHRLWRVVQIAKRGPLACPRIGCRRIRVFVSRSLAGLRGWKCSGLGNAVGIWCCTCVGFQPTYGSHPPCLSALCSGGINLLPAGTEALGR
jgi:hypothetical protein